MTPETTNAQSYELTEGRITRVNTERGNVRFNGESFEDWMLRHEIPQLREMHTVYREIARRLNQLAEAAEISLTMSVETGPEDLYSFDAQPDLDALAKVQGVSPTVDIRDLATDDWPEDESVEDFIAAAMEGRHDEDEPDS